MKFSYLIGVIPVRNRDLCHLSCKSVFKWYNAVLGTLGKYVQFINVKIGELNCLMACD
jgi:hypothetical protein